MKILGIDTSCDDTAVALLKIEKEGARQRREGGGSGVVKFEAILYRHR